MNMLRGSKQKRQQPQPSQPSQPVRNYAAESEIAELRAEVERLRQQSPKA